MAERWAGHLPRRRLMSEKVEGMAQEMGGRVQEAVGEATRDTGMQARGIYNQAAGQAQAQLARLSEVIRDQPLTAVLIALGVGYMLGRLTA
jgi:uncharacterized protein YjbJ (UPF0337 family)